LILTEMTKRMQILIDHAEYRRIQRVARSRGMTVAEWVRQALRRVYQREPLGDRDKKLAAVRAAALHEFPSADIDQMLEEIGRVSDDGAP
jgi:hypothetical protein